MASYYATVKWENQKEDFLAGHYSRGHTWHFDGGIVVPASSSPHIVPLPYSVEENVDPEEAFVASLASCHMLFFLSIAAKRKLTVIDYQDDAEGIMAKNAQNKLAVTQVILRPKVKFLNADPTPEQIKKLHHLAHESCFLANSVTSEIIVEC